MAPARADRASRTNAQLIEEVVPGIRLVRFPRVDWPGILEASRWPANVRRALDRLLNETDM
jgi:hypothetical protein